MRVKKLVPLLGWLSQVSRWMRLEQVARRQGLLQVSRREPFGSAPLLLVRVRGLAWRWVRR
jgi:hypothetical protein